MRSGLLRAVEAENKKLVNGLNYLRTFVIAGILLCGLPALSQVTVDSGLNRTFSVCEHSAFNISQWLTVTDPTPALTITWSLVSGPSHGTLTGLESPQVATSGGTVTPTAIVYTPSDSSTDQIQISVSDGVNPVQNVFITFNNNTQPSFSLINTNIPVCAGTTAALLSFTDLANAGPKSITFNYTGNETLWSIPVGVTSLNFDVQGARGGRQNATPPVYLPGYGARVQGTLNVTNVNTLYLFVGGVGGDGALDGAPGGFNGGGNSYGYLYGSGGAGGGASDIRIGDDGLPNRVVVAGGGAGDGWDSTGTLAGGNGGGLTGGNSANNGGLAPTNRAGGGTQSAGGTGALYAGWLPGMDGSLGMGGNGSLDGISGGGGGGYYGGGGGVWTGGGGGSSYANAGSTSGVVYTNGYDTTNGVIVFNYTIPATYTIAWDGPAHIAGFTDVTAALPASPIALNIPLGTAPAVYTGKITIANTTCTSPEYTFSVTVNAIPTMNPVSGQTVCHGDSTSDILFTGAPDSVHIDYNWVSSNPDFGLGLIGYLSIGTGQIGKFPPQNNSLDQVIIDTFVVTPTANECIGVSQTFTITAIPELRLHSTTTPAGICDSGTFAYLQDPYLPGTTFTWSRANISGLINGDTVGAGSEINEVFINTTNAVIPVVYIDTLHFGNCKNVQPVTVNVYPYPVLTSTLTPAAICSGAPFEYTANSSFDGTSLSWSRTAVSGISNMASLGASGSISETLIDTTANQVVAVYVYTLSVNSGVCNYTQNVTLTVNPTPRINSPAMSPVCDSTAMSYVATSATTGTTFAWSRGAVAGITNPARTSTGAEINDTLVNSTPLPVVVTYADTLTANGCINVEYLTNTVFPRPVLSTTLTPDSICSNTVFTYVPESLTPGTEFAWYRDTIVGINESPNSGGFSIDEILINTTHDIIPVIYVYTLTANGCSNTQNVTVKVDPTPVLQSPSVAAPICDSTIFSYVPVGATANSTFTWTRAYVPGINEFPGSGADSVHESLVNTTYINVAVTYVFNITANGCSNTQDVSVIVHPTPRLYSDSAQVICSGSDFLYYPASYTPTTSFAWSAAAVAGITPTGNNGTGIINETITSSLSVPANIAFLYTLTAYGCSHNEIVNVTVNPSPATPGISIHPGSSLCDNTMYQNFGTSVPPAAGMSYNWITDNGTVWAIGNDGQYALINFTTPGVATVYLVTQNDTTGCQLGNTFQVNVGSSVSPSHEVIYFAGQFICKNADVDNYQWGYDDAVTFDSTLITGENNQNYFNQNPDTANKYYWVMTTKGDCSQKSYFNTPRSSTGIVTMNSSETVINVYPNPAADNVNVEIGGVNGGNIKIEITNMLGQKLGTTAAVNNRARLDVASLPNGCYMIDCFREGVKVASAKFVKN